MIDAAIPPVDAPTLTLDCPTYCMQIMANCTGTNAQYVDNAHCMAACATFDAQGSAVTDQTGNTLGCRLHFAAEALNQTLATDDCAFAGPAGELVNANPAAHCSDGDVCNSFCTLEIASCGSLDQPLAGDPKGASGNSLYQYVNQANCVQNCDTLNKNNLYSPTSKGDSYACRLLQATNAAISVIPNAKMFCSSTGVDPTDPCTGTASP
ncbi:MAG TPA: hypothetical protein VFP84_27770 [Kofleriaceae bacterium]|nr:hypothetical protein [Kofleriaceae bacterium]